MNLDQLLTRNPVPSATEMQSRLDNIWERLQSEIENTAATERVAIFVSIRPTWVFPNATWAVAGIVLAVILVTGLVWRQGPPFGVAARTGNANENSVSKSSRLQRGETLQVILPRETFDVASIKLVEPSSEIARRASQVEAFQLAAGLCAGNIGSLQIDPGRLRIPATTVLSLVMVAYGQDCTLVEGGPAWARSGEYYEINALLPSGTPSYAGRDLANGKAPRLQGMLQNLLADRFRLVVRHELREMSVYVLSVAIRGKMTLSPGETRPAPASFPNPPDFPPPVLGRGQSVRLLTASGVHMSGHAISIPALAKDLRQYAGRLVIDKTGLNDDVFDIDLNFARDPALSPLPAARLPQAIPPLPEPSLPGPPPLRIAMEEQLGLKLESARMPIEVLIIERVERPSEN
jgi:uncharacterized protein (TIGR03435 family)